MEKIFVIGLGTGLDAVEKAEKLLELKDNVEVICIENKEDIPINERFKDNNHNVKEVFKFEARKFIDASFFETKKHKGHERPYKFHP